MSFSLIFLQDILNNRLGTSPIALAIDGAFFERCKAELPSDIYKNVYLVVSLFD
jgi:hypothetical protein